ncbi:hypothetical protein [Mesorhizobium sp. A556]
MTALLTLLASKAGTYIIGGVAILAAFVATYVKGRLSGAKLERDHQAASEAKARDIADQVDNDIGALPGSKAREELGKWSKH